MSFGRPLYFGLVALLLLLFTAARDPDRGGYRARPATGAERRLALAQAAVVAGAELWTASSGLFFAIDGVAIVVLVAIVMDGRTEWFARRA